LFGLKRPLNQKYLTTGNLSDGKPVTQSMQAILFKNFIKMPKYPGMAIIRQQIQPVGLPRPLTVFQAAT
jgi:hypothetical protein